MDKLGDLLEALENRLRSRVVGSILIAFLFLNWKSIYFVIFGDVPAVEKFSFVDAHSSSLRTIILPLALGVIASIVLPWVNYLSIKLAAFPEILQRKVRNDSLHQDLIDKLEYETKLEEVKARRRSAVIESAQAGQAAKSIADPEVRDRVEAEFKGIEDITEIPDAIIDEDNVDEDLIDGLTLEQIQSEAFRLGVEINELRELIAEGESQLIALMAEEKSEEERYIRLKNDHDDEDGLKMKLYRAEQMEIFKQRKDDLESSIDYFSQPLKNKVSVLEELEATLSRRYGL